MQLFQRISLEPSYLFSPCIRHGHSVSRLKEKNIPKNKSWNSLYQIMRKPFLQPGNLRIIVGGIVKKLSWFNIWKIVKLSYMNIIRRHHLIEKRVSWPRMDIKTFSITIMLQLRPLHLRSQNCRNYSSNSFNCLSSSNWAFLNHHHLICQSGWRHANAYFVWFEYSILLEKSTKCSWFGRTARS